MSVRGPGTLPARTGPRWRRRPSASLLGERFPRPSRWQARRRPPRRRRLRGRRGASAGGVCDANRSRPCAP
eukprot:752383-Pleurochrysis_carterae.AAC.1